MAKKLSASENSPEDNTEPSKYRSLETLARGLFYIENLYVEPERVKRDRIVNDALHGIVSKLDPHTMLMESKQFKQLTIDTQGKFGGVGIIVSSERGRLIVVSPIEDTPAFRAGIKSGDEIIAIDGMKIKDIKQGQTTERMRGKPDTKIILTIKRKGEEKPLEFELVREIIKVKSVKHKQLDDAIFYARITSFQDNTSSELKEAIEKAKKPIKGLVLDLRDNPGGLLDQAVKVSDMFIESGLIVSTVGRDRNDVEREFANKRGTYLDFPMVTLVNGGSASASEIVAGALQDHERSIILGTTSFGKGSVQTLVSLPNRSGLKITVARYYTPKDRSIQAKGIKPDIEVAQKLRDQKKPSKKEADLKGHIESKDLSDLAKNSNLSSKIAAWNKADQQDHQLVTAYTYVRGWNRMQPPAGDK
jgi:carboxyl-terminal processing protease